MLFSEEKMRKSKKDVEKEAVNLTRRSSCLLGGCKLLMEDWTWRAVREVRAGERVMDRNLRGEIQSVISLN